MDTRSWENNDIYMSIHNVFFTIHLKLTRYVHNKITSVKLRLKINLPLGELNLVKFTTLSVNVTFVILLCTITKFL